MTFSKQVGLHLHLIFFIFLLLNPSEAKRCYSSSCGGGTNVDVRFPFWLFPKHSSSCGHDGFNLLCTDRHETALKLPNSGLFIVGEIDYEKQRIRLNDPNNCLARRVLSFDATESPFSPLHLLNYTILSCPKDDIKPSSPYKLIHCLGNSTSSFFAARSDLASSMPSSCQIFKTLLLPVSSPLPVDLNDQEDLWLKWDSPNCGDCESNRSLCGFKNKTTLEIKCCKSLKSGLYNFIVLVLKLICLFLIALLVAIATFVAYVTFSAERLPTQIRRHVSRLFARKPRSGRAKSAIVGLYKKVVLERNMKLPGRNDAICPICLSEYASNETIGCLLGCEHCFHVECIDTWLHLHSSCPICRNQVSPKPNFCY
ncbi:unnamed protein product [Microthlaspi erraticum]|uniref:RING-type E3 ubiquitin transferase n=1 Tax=Microthlaspi erraticum TaxID=1685480 RepID=A0A6D2JBZ3_9BRAS|nr:unnamed protein product [Microthlaspi erraticum]